MNAINEVREVYQEEFGGTYTPLKWSPDLANDARKWANDIAEVCRNGVPGAVTNPNDFGVATILNMRNPQLAVDRWVQNGEPIYLMKLSYSYYNCPLTSLPHQVSLLTMLVTFRRLNPIHSHRCSGLQLSMSDVLMFNPTDLADFALRPFVTMLM